MNKFVATIDKRKYIIEKKDDKYIYNGNILDNILVDKFISNIIKLCLGNERKKKISSNNKIEIYFDDRTSLYKGIDIHVIRYLEEFLK
ncbi:MAG: hypothetical protein IJN90_07470 [Bacilli bacterium]|nr:hypothetical protein [Bacilli bacterium]